jgi:diguanylate cyclase (GGDEF)-like protein
MMLDIDHFKRFNDSFGHEAGDYVLKQLGLMMKNFVRKEDIACRYGGEEFTFILPETALESALRRAEEFCERMRTLDLRYQDKSLGLVTVSIGVAGFPQHGAMPEALLRTADSALYRAKKEGRDRAVLAG